MHQRDAQVEIKTITRSPSAARTETVEGKKTSLCHSSAFLFRVSSRDRTWTFISIPNLFSESPRNHQAPLSLHPRISNLRAPTRTSCAHISHGLCHSCLRIILIFVGDFSCLKYTAIFLRCVSRLLLQPPVVEPKDTFPSKLRQRDVAHGSARIDLLKGRLLRWKTRLRNDR